MESSRSLTASKLRAALARYRGGRFEVGGSGGANGMVFYVDPAGKHWFIGGFGPDHAETLTAALNLVLELLESSRFSAARL